MREELDFSTMGITDDFMFGTVFQDLGLCRGLVEVLLGIEVRDLRMVERQELVDFGPASRAGIVDLLVRDVDGNVYDVEMQNGAEPDIARRARRYLSRVTRASWTEANALATRKTSLCCSSALMTRLDGGGSATTTCGCASRTASRWGMGRA